MTNATPSSLMRRTKAELVNIILRKDETETNAAKEIKTLNERISEYESLCRKRTDELYKLKNINGSNQSFICELTENNKKLKNTLICSYVIFVIIIILNILL